MKNHNGKKLQLGRETLRPLIGRSLAAIRGGRDADDGTLSGYPPCNSFYPPCKPAASVLCEPTW